VPSLFRCGRWEQPGQQLPVAANPTPHAVGVHQVARRKFLVQGDICDQRGSSVNPFKQVVAEKGILANLTGQAAFKRGDIIYPLSDVAPFAKQILIHIRYGKRVQVKTGIHCKYCEKRERFALAGLMDTRGCSTV